MTDSLEANPYSDADIERLRRCIAGVPQDLRENSNFRWIATLDQERAKRKKLEWLLRWALDQIAEQSQSTGETPDHDCEYITDPPAGHCSFHDKYWTALELLSAEPADTPAKQEPT